MNESYITIYEWIEAHCPFCRYVENSILRDIQARRVDINKQLAKQGMYPMPPIELRLVDIEGNKDSKEMQWFSQYSQKIGGVYTPAIRVEKSDKVFYLWGKQGQEESATKKLKSQIVQEIQNILTKVDKKPLLYEKEFYNQRNVMHKPPVRPMYKPFGGFR